MNCLVTGGCGFIGSHLCEALAGAGHRVRVLDDLSTGKRENLSAIARQVELVGADVRDAAAVERAAQGADCVFHLAAVVSVGDSVKNPLKVNAINVTGTLNVLEAARKAGAGSVVFSSTCALYGDLPGLPKTEDMPRAPQSPYAASKAASEHYLAVYARLFDITTVVLRFFNVYGPRQDPFSPYAGVISRFAEAAQAGTTPRINGDGMHTRDFVFVADVVAALVAAMSLKDPGPGEIFNVGTGKQTTLLDLVDTLRKVTGKDLAPVHGPERPGDVRQSEAGVEKLRNVMGLTAKTGLPKGLLALWDSMNGTTK